jgi:hypothetical protein
MAAVKRLGLDDSAITEIMAVVDLFNGLASFVDGLAIETDIRPQ